MKTWYLIKITINYLQISIFSKPIVDFNDRQIPGHLPTPIFSIPKLSIPIYFLLGFKD